MDEKRVLDLSPQRLASIQSFDPEVLEDLGEPLTKALAFYSGLTHDTTRLLKSLAKAIGDPDLHAEGDIRFNYRMVDYYPRATTSLAPRCGTHRDFGPMTLIFQDSSNGSGLQVWNF